MAKVGQNLFGNFAIFQNLYYLKETRKTMEIYNL